MIMGLVFALLAGVVMGLVGGGGGIILVPVMVYAMGVDTELSTAYALFIVGVAACVGTYRNHKSKTISKKNAVIFGIPTILGVLLARVYVLPAIPDLIPLWGDYVLAKNMAIIFFFAFVMLAAAYSMLTTKREDPDGSEVVNLNYAKVSFQGILIGLVTGLVGSGGGFLIVPALIFLARLPVKVAIGTSLFIIAMKSLVGFLADLQLRVIDWQFLFTITAVTVIGILLGTHLNRYINGRKLKKGFAVFIIIMAGIIFYMEVS